MRAFVVAALTILLAGCATSPAALPPPPSAPCSDRELWRVALPEDGSAYAPHIATDGARMVIAGAHAAVTNVTLVRLDGTGVAWTARIEKMTPASVAFAGDVVILVEEVAGSGEVERGLLGLDAATGAELWRFVAPPATYAQFAVVPPANASPVVVHAMDKLWANEPRSAASVWTWQSEGSLMDVVAEGDMLFAHDFTHGYDLVGIEAATGEVRWRNAVRQIADPLFEPGVVVHDSVAASVREVQIVDRITGEVLAHDRGLVSSWQYHNRTHDINASYDAGIVTSYDRHTRAPLWSFQAERSSGYQDAGWVPGNPGYTSPTVRSVGDDVLVEASNATVGPYRSSGGGPVHERWWMIEGADGRVRWERSVAHREDFLGSFDGALLFAGPGQLAAVDATTGAVRWACAADGWPEARDGGLYLRSPGFLARLA